MRKKMKRSIYKSGTILFISLILVNLTLKAEEVTKTFHKEYAADAKTTLEIINKYGDIDIQSWDKNQVVIDVKVSIELPNREKAEKLLGYIDVQFSEGDKYLSAKTVIDDKFSFTGWGGDSRKFSIDYTIKMPAETALTLSNKYGDTEFNDLKGLLNLDIKYGNLTAGKMLRGNIKPLNRLNLSYGKGDIEEAGWLDLTVRYVNSFNIDKSQALLLDSKYSKLSLGTTSSLVGESKYDNLKIESINNLVLNNGYTETRIGSLSKKLTYEGSYGSFTVENVPAGFESLEVDTRYMGVRLGIEESASYKLEGKVSYGGLKYNEDNFKNEKRIIENNSTEISGIVGREESPKSTVSISASYGTVKLF
jgi:hypothetical protein